MSISIPELVRHLRAIFKFDPTQFFVRAGGGNQMHVTLARPNDGPEDFPFNVSMRYDSDLDTYYYQVTAGTLNGNYPTILDWQTAIDESLAESPKPEAEFLGPDGTGKVWLHVSVTLTVPNDFVTVTVETTWAMESGNAKPADDEVAGEYYISIAAFVSGSKTAQSWKTSLSAYYIDTLLGDGSASIKVNGITS